ncbi:Uncharacterised protein [Burkholderia pseudomallei]|nr:Uncharacterised protein [Burkholderia pseudomallei]
MRPLLPTTTAGRPGSVTPTTRAAGPAPPPSLNIARYQMFGRPNDRCMSSPTIAAPLAVRLPASAQLLLPTADCPSIDTPLTDVAGRASRSQAGAVALTGAAAAAMPGASSGASKRLDGGSKNASCSGVECACSQCRANSRDASLPCRSKYIAQITSSESSGRHRCGCMRSSAYSNGRARSAASPSFTPCV